MTKHKEYPTIPTGVYLDGSRTALVYRVARGTVNYIPMDPPYTLKRAPVAEFLHRYDRWMEGYPLERAAVIFLNSVLAGVATAGALEVLRGLAGVEDDLLS